MKVDSSQTKDVHKGGEHSTIASYLEQQIKSYQGNPFIEALPPILTEDSAIEALARYPAYDESERQMPSHLRLHAMQNALQCFEPLPVHIDLEQRFSRMIRAGYQMRNPLDRGFWRNIDDGCRALAPSTAVVQNRAHSIPLGFTIIGFPGVGKSTSVEAILSLYPQVIYHSRYHDHKFPVAQIVWLKLECPHDGSIKGLCLNFFQALDELLGTNYTKNYGGGRRTTDEMLPNIARLAAIHGIGVLVIDEINRLSGANKGGAARMLSFFVQLTNSLGVPVVLIGTFKAKNVLSGEFHQIRRGTGQGDLVWDRMEEGTWVECDESKSDVGSEKPGVWQLLLESLWAYQYTRVDCPLTKELSHVLYEETQGITDFAAKIYMLAQVRAITTAQGPEDELITGDIIRSVARDSLKQAQLVLAALRRGDTSFLSTVPDINPISIDDFVRQAEHSLHKRSKASGQMLKEEALPPGRTPYGESPRHEADDILDAPEPRKPRKPKAPKLKPLTIYEEGDLRAGVVAGQSTQTPAFDALRHAGHTASADEFLESETAA